MRDQLDTLCAHLHRSDQSSMLSHASASLMGERPRGRRRGLLCRLMLSGLFLFPSAACLNASVGSLGGPCNQKGVCLEGLTCSSGICVKVEEEQGMPMSAFDQALPSLPGPSEPPTPPRAGQDARLPPLQRLDAMVPVGVGAPPPPQRCEERCDQCAECAADCVDLSSDPNNCGGCGQRCTETPRGLEELCLEGECVPDCARAMASDCECSPTAPSLCLTQPYHQRCLWYGGMSYAESCNARCEIERMPCRLSCEISGALAPEASCPEEEGVGDYVLQSLDGPEGCRVSCEAAQLQYRGQIREIMRAENLSSIEFCCVHDHEPRQCIATRRRLPVDAGDRRWLIRCEMRPIIDGF